MRSFLGTPCLPPCALFQGKRRTNELFEQRLRHEVEAANVEILRAGESAKILKEYNENILASLSSGVLVVDLNGAVTTFNRVASSLFGAPASTMIGKPLRDNPRLEPLERLLSRTMETGVNIRRNELVITTADGREIPLGVSTSLLYSQTTGSNGAIAVFTDLSQTKSLEERVKHSEKLAILGEMAAVMAHEIRNPLNSIAGFSQLLQMKIYVSDKLRKYVDIIVHESFRIDDLISDILDFAHQKKNIITLIDFKALADQVLSSKQALASRKGVVIETRIGDDLPAFRGDSVRLERVMLNLVNNALDATDSGGLVTLSAIRADHNGIPWIEMTVADTGCGIPPENLEDIFKPFFTTKQAGTGLGLAIIQKIAEEHLGKVTVTSDLLNGTVFTLSLPCARDLPAL